MKDTSDLFSRIEVEEEVFLGVCGEGESELLTSVVGSAEAINCERNNEVVDGKQLLNAVVLVSCVQVKLLNRLLQLKIL